MGSGNGDRGRDGNFRGGGNIAADPDAILAALNLEFRDSFLGSHADQLPNLIGSHVTE
jgi:hypothetical protein